MDELLNKIKSLATEYQAEIITLRRHLHQHPELSFKEYNTAKFVSEKLKEYGIKHQSLSLIHI